MSHMTRTEAYDYLNDRFHMDEMVASDREKMIDDLVAMEHRPWCRTHLAHVFPNYGADCTCGTA